MEFGNSSGYINFNWKSRKEDINDKIYIKEIRIHANNFMGNNYNNILFNEFYPWRSCIGSSAKASARN